MKISDESIKREVYEQGLEALKRYDNSCQKYVEGDERNMKNATVTIDYTSFQAIKEKADKYDELIRAREDVLNKNEEFIETLCISLEKANEQKDSANKQYFIAEGIKAICSRFDMDLKVEYGELDEGKAPIELDI